MWYRKANITGEYWLTEDGPQFAAGEDNHEMLAEGHMLNNLGNDIEDAYWGTQTYDNARLMFLDALEHPRGQMGDYIKELQAEHGDNWWDYATFDSYLVWLNTQQYLDEEVKKTKKDWVEREIAGMKDPRKHVSQYYDWVRVEHNNVEAWVMNDTVRRRIANQLEEIYGDENDDYEDDSWKDKPIFDLSILSTGKYIPGVSYYDLVEGGEKKRMLEPEVMQVAPRRTVSPYYKYEGG